MNTAADVVILGGGVMGLTSAYYLANEGLRVAVLDRGEIGRQSSWAGAGILPPSNLAHARKPLDRLRALSQSLFPALSNTLLQATGIDNGYRECGGLQFAGVAPSDPFEWAGEGVTTEWLDEKSAARLEPNLADGLGAVRRIPSMAQVRNPWQLRALVDACKHSGRVQIEPNVTTTRWIRSGDGLSAIETSSGNWYASHFVLAAGAWSDELTTSLGTPLGVHPVRGQIALLRTKDPVLRHILLWGDSYIVPREDGRVLVGSTEEHVGFENRTTAEAIGRLLSLAGKLAPALRDAEVEKCWAGLRPGSPDGAPFLGLLPGYSNAWVCAGHFRSGLQLSAGSALLLTQMILSRPTTIDAAPFRTDRLAPGFALAHARSLGERDEQGRGAAEAI